MKPSLKSSSTIYDYVKVQQLDGICQIRHKKQTRRQNMAVNLKKTMTILMTITGSPSVDLC
jgi:hypothetical protein